MKSDNWLPEVVGKAGAGVVVGFGVVELVVLVRIPRFRLAGS